MTEPRTQTGRRFARRYVGSGHADEGDPTPAYLSDIIAIEAEAYRLGYEARRDESDVLVYAALAWHDTKSGITDPRGGKAAETQRAAWALDDAAETYRARERKADIKSMQEADR